MKKFVSMLAGVILILGMFVVPSPAQADDPNTEFPSCQVSVNPSSWSEGYYYLDSLLGNWYPVYRMASEPTGGSGSACEDINFTPIDDDPDLWNDRTFARVYVCPTGGCYWSSWVWLGSWGGVIMPGVPNSMWYYIEWASAGTGVQSPYGNLQAWD